MLSSRCKQNADEAFCLQRLLSIFGSIGKSLGASVHPASCADKLEIFCQKNMDRLSEKINFKDLTQKLLFLI